MSGIHKHKSKKILRSIRKPHDHDPAGTAQRKLDHKVKSLVETRKICAQRLRADKDDENAWLGWKRTTAELGALGVKTE